MHFCSDYQIIAWQVIPQWEVFNFAVGAYPVFIMDIVIIIVTIINIIRFRKSNKESVSSDLNT